MRGDNEERGVERRRCVEEVVQRGRITPIPSRPTREIRAQVWEAKEAKMMEVDVAGREVCMKERWVWSYDTVARPA